MDRKNDETETGQAAAVRGLKNLREKVVDKGVCGAEEMIELLDILLVSATGETGEPKLEIPTPPNSDAIGGMKVG